MSRQYVTQTLSQAVLDVLGGFALDVFTENGPQPNFAQQSRAWALFEVAFDARTQISLGQSYGRLAGGLQVGIFEKVGDGTALTLQVMDALDTALASRSLSGITMGRAMTFRPHPFDQWSPLGVQYMFWYDDLPAQDDTPPDGGDGDVPAGQVYTLDGSTLQTISGDALVTISQD